MLFWIICIVIYIVAFALFSYYDASYDTMLVALESLCVVAPIVILYLIFKILIFIGKRCEKVFKENCNCKLLLGLNENGMHNVRLGIAGNVLKIFSSNNRTLKTIGLKNIKNISLVTDEVLDEKEKSTIGRAIIGGLVFGVAGAVVGGMSGMGTKKEYKLVKLIKIETNDTTLFALPDEYSDAGQFLRNCRSLVYKYKEDN